MRSQNARRLWHLLYSAMITIMVVLPAKAYGATQGSDNIPVQCTWANAVKPSTNVIVGNLKGLVGSLAGTIILSLVLSLILFAAFEVRHKIVRIIVWTMGAVLAVLIVPGMLAPILPNWC